MKALNAVRLSGAEVLPLIEGGKGVSITTGRSSGGWAAAGGASARSLASMRDYYDENGNRIEQVYRGRTRRERHEELVAYGVRGGIAQARIAHDVRGGAGRLHVNSPVGDGGAPSAVLTGILDGRPGGLIHGVTCGAGMPYRPRRHRRPLWRVLLPDHLVGARVPGHCGSAPTTGAPSTWGPLSTKTRGVPAAINGLSNSEDPKAPQPPYPRVRDLRAQMTRPWAASYADRRGGRCVVPCESGRTGSTIPNLARSCFNSVRVRCSHERARSLMIGRNGCLRSRAAMCP